MTDISIEFKQKIYELYKQNPYINYLGMDIAELAAGTAVIEMPVAPEKHTNMLNVAHGGAIASLADTAMGVSCVTTGKRVVTIEMNINYLKAAEPQQIKAIGRVIHYGKTIMVAEAEITGSSGELLAKSRGSFFVLGELLPG